MKYLITGADGQLGYDVRKELDRRGIPYLSTDASTMDITDMEAVLDTIGRERPDGIFHLAAWTAVDAAEDSREACFRVNADGTRNIAEASARFGSRLIYISTDYVFSGDGTRPWTPDEKEFHPVNAYGESKRQGEIAVEELSKDYAIVRISWVFGINGRNFIRTMLELGKTHKELTVVDDQIGSPTYTHDLSKLLVDIMQSDERGVFHATNTGFCSWYELAGFVFDEARRLGHREYDDVVVKPVPSSGYPTKARRPRNSRMDCRRLSECGFTPLPDWRDAAGRFIKELGY